jgi:hypothetical protein
VPQGRVQASGQRQVTGIQQAGELTLTARLISPDYS